MTKKADLGLNMLRDRLLDGASRGTNVVEESKGRSATARRIISYSFNIVDTLWEGVSRCCSLPSGLEQSFPQPL